MKNRAASLNVDGADLIGGSFTVNAERAGKILPSGRRPVRITPGTALACVYCAEGAAKGVGSFREVVVGIPLAPEKSALPGAIGALTELFAGRCEVFPCLVAFSGRPRGGFFGPPEFAADVEFRETATHRICTLRNPRSRELILEFDFKKIPVGSAWTRWTRRDLACVFAGGASRQDAVVTLEPEAWGAAFLLPSLALRWGRDGRAAALKDLGWGLPLFGARAPRVRAVLSEAKRRKT